MLLLHMQDLNSLTRYKYFYINTHRLKEGDLTATYRINRPPKGRHARRTGEEAKKATTCTEGHVFAGLSV